MQPVLISPVVIRRNETKYENANWKVNKAFFRLLRLPCHAEPFVDLYGHLWFVYVQRTNIDADYIPQR